jgi:hypothetical protein
VEIDIGNAFKHPAVTYIAGLVIGCGLGWALHDLLRGVPLGAAGQAPCVDCAQRDIAEARQRISGYVDPRAYGAKADGVTDNTPAFQAAIDDAARLADTLAEVFDGQASDDDS